MIQQLRPTLKFLTFLVGAVLAASISGCGSAETAVCDNDSPPFTVKADLFDQDRPHDLGLESAAGSETIMVFRPAEDGNTYNHGAVLMPFKGRLYAQWQTSRRDEDAADTHVVYSSSADGITWSPPSVLAPERSGGIRTSGGWWSDGETLIAYINEWPAQDESEVGGHTRFVASTDGLNWSDPADVTSASGARVDGIFEQDPRALDDGRIVSAFHMQPGLIVSPWYTDSPLGVSGWRRGDMPNLPHEDLDSSRELEPSSFVRADGAIVMIFRDQAGSFRKLASVSCDRGETWSQPVVTDMPDARTKQSAGNLPDGTAYMVGNPVTRRDRFPLALVLSADGRHFDRAFLLRDGKEDPQALRHPGRYKRAGYSYPKSVVWNEHLYVAYATNKEDVEITRVPLRQLAN